jgi:hypothetical protein
LAGKPRATIYDELKMLEQFKKTGKEALADLKKVNDLAALEEFRIKYLSRKGR